MLLLLFVIYWSMATGNQFVSVSKGAVFNVSLAGSVLQVEQISPDFDQGHYRQGDAIDVACSTPRYPGDETPRSCAVTFRPPYGSFHVYLGTFFLANRSIAHDLSLKPIDVDPLMGPFYFQDKGFVLAENGPLSSNQFLAAFHAENLGLSYYADPSSNFTMSSHPGIQVLGPGKPQICSEIVDSTGFGGKFGCLLAETGKAAPSFAPTAPDGILSYYTTGAGGPGRFGSDAGATVRVTRPDNSLNPGHGCQNVSISYWFAGLENWVNVASIEPAKAKSPINCVDFPLVMYRDEATGDPSLLYRVSADQRPPYPFAQLNLNAPDGLFHPSWVKVDPTVDHAIVADFGRFHPL